MTPSSSPPVASDKSRIKAQLAAHVPHGAKTEIKMITVEGQVVRVGFKPGDNDRPALLLFNGIGANLELAAPFTESEALAHYTTVIFDVPGIGGSPAPILPYRLPGLARLARGVLNELGIKTPVDVLGVSWGGAAAQQFAWQYPKLCRRLVLCATSPGSVMVPGKFSAIRKMANPKRYTDPTYLLEIGADIYGGIFRKEPHQLQRHASMIRPPKGIGYYYQLLAAAGWTSIAWLHRLTQPTLILAGADDPIVPLPNAQILAFLIPKSRLVVIDDGHLFVATQPQETATTIRSFLEESA